MCWMWTVLWAWWTTFWRAKDHCPQDMGTSGEEVIEVLPDDMVEKIVGMVPFPSVCKARYLSKEWKARFSPTSTQRDEAGKFLATGLQIQVREWSHKWPTFCPVFFANQDAFAYHQATQSWTRMPPPSFLPDLSFTTFVTKMHIQMEGPLLLASNLQGYHPTYVANVLTGSWKMLPSCHKYYPRIYELENFLFASAAFCERLVINVSKETYQVLRFCRPFCWPSDGPSIVAGIVNTISVSRSRQVCILLYDSESDSWTRKLAVLPGEFISLLCKIKRSVYLDGMLYMVADNDPRRILAYSLEEGTFKTLSVVYPGRPTTHVWSVDLVVCDGTLLMVVAEGLLRQTHVVLKIDLESQVMLELARGPPGPAVALIFTEFMRPVAEGNFIFIGMESRMNIGGSRRLVTYDLDRSRWSSILLPVIEGDSDTAALRDHPFDYWHCNYPHGLARLIPSSFRPGLMPFMEP